MGSEHWLLAYEANRNGWLPAPAVATDPAFAGMHAAGVAFLTEPSAFPSILLLLRRSPAENCRTSTRSGGGGVSLKKVRKEEGGLEAEVALLGPALFLDVWAVREISRDQSKELRARLVGAVRTRGGSLLTSAAWFTELDTVRGDARARAAAFLSALGSHWLPINPVVSVVAGREAKDELGSYLSLEALNGFVIERCGEVLRADADLHSLTDDEFFDLGRALVWAKPEPADAPNPHLVALKAAARTRAEADAAAQRQDGSACDRLYPELPPTSARMMRVHNAVWREVTRRAPGRTWLDNDGFDIAHLIPAMAIGGFIAVDRQWQEIATSAARELEPPAIRLYCPDQLPELVDDLEHWAP